MPQKVLEMCPRAAQTSPIDRVWNVGTIYDGIMVRGVDRLAIRVTDDRSTSRETVEQLGRAAVPQNASETLYRATVRISPKQRFQENLSHFWI